MCHPWMKRWAWNYMITVNHPSGNAPPPTPPLRFLYFYILPNSIEIKHIKPLLRVVGYQCETSSFTLKARIWSRLLGNKVQERIFGREGMEVTIRYRNFHNKKLRTFIRQIILEWSTRERWDVDWSRNTIGKEKRLYRNLDRKHEGKKPLGWFNIFIIYTYIHYIHIGFSLITTTWRVLRLQIEETASRYGGKLRIYWIISRWQPTRGGLPA
jgi:hypothetical protein